MKNTILVTGAGGYIGSVASYVFLQNGYKVIAVDNFTTGYKQPLEELQKKFGNSQLKVYETNLKQIASVFEQEKNIDMVVHYAASCLVDESVKNPFKYFDNNVGGTNSLLKAMTDANVLKLVFSSTCAVYGEAQYMPIDEKHPLAPSQPYGASKQMVEELIEWYAQLKKLNYVILRYFNVCGATDDGLIGDSKKPSSLLMQNAVRGALNIEPFALTCPEVDTPDKTPIRDYVNVVDLNEAHLKALEHLMANKQSEIINLGTGAGNSVMEIINQVKKITGASFEVGKTTPREGDDAKKIADITKAKQVLGWVPKRSVADSVNALVKWYKVHPNGWDK
ncbi:MAG: UDP-glucose 4-epimerase GalE [Candidatus Roizmanbacteria bacterium]|nr:UDP-glucose 4-epimerase GalE [Candidatus Roizmanbacteria bacterium]